MKQIRKIILITIFILLLSITISNASIDTNTFKPNALTEDDYDVAFNMAGTIINAITTIGIVIAVIMVMVLGIKYMVASVEQKADYKRTMIPMIVGAILLFASSTFVSIIYSLISKIE